MMCNVLTARVQFEQNKKLLFTLGRASSLYGIPRIAFFYVSGYPKPRRHLQQTNVLILFSRHVAY